MKLYIITNGNGNYLTLSPTNSITTTSKLSLAQRYSKEKASNVMRNLPNTLKNIGFHIEEDIEANILLAEKYSNLSEKENEILEKVKDFESYLKEIGKIRDDLAEELSTVDQQIEDILHAAEFYNLNACEGYKLYKMLHEKRVRRRELKNFIEKVGFIEGCTGKDLAGNRGSKSILGTQNRKYQPKILGELFVKEK